MTEIAVPESIQTNETENQTIEKKGQKKSAKSQTTIKWSIVTENETKSLTAKAAKKAGRKLFEWVDMTLRDAATTEITNKAQPPARAEDLVADIVKQFADRVEASQAATSQAQSDLIAQQGEQIATLTQTVETLVNRPQPTPPTFREMLFGRKKND